MRLCEARITSQECSQEWNGGHPYHISQIPSWLSNQVISTKQSYSSPSFCVWLQLDAEGPGPTEISLPLVTAYLLSPALSPHSTCCPWWWNTLAELGFLDISTTGSTFSWPCEHLLGTSSQSVQIASLISSSTLSGPSSDPRTRVVETFKGP